MDTKFCKHCGKEIDFEYKREKVTKTKVSGGVVTYTGETELVKKYNSAICSKCGGTFCLDCIKSECRDKYRNIVLKNLCPTCYNPDLADCTHESSKYNYVGTTEENGEEFIVHEKICNACGKTETIKEKIDECNHIFGNKQLVRYDNNFKHFEKTCIICGEVKGFAEPLDKIKSESGREQGNNNPDKQKRTLFPKIKIPKLQLKKIKLPSFSSSKNRYKTKSNPKNNGLIKFLMHNPILAIVIAIAIFGFLDSSDYIHYDIMDSEYRAKSLPFTGAASSSLSLDNYPNTTDPTYNELLQFIMNDKTDTILYDYDSFVCADYAVTVHNNAEKVGIKAGVVDVSFYDDSDGHALNVFNTTDKGLVFIDCTGNPENYGKNNCDTVVNLEIGKEYIPRPLFSSGFYYESMGAVKDFNTYW